MDRYIVNPQGMTGYPPLICNLTQMSNIETSVTRLLVATKQLIETLTAWSRRQASENDVSDVYVRLGNEFNIARTSFQRAGIEMGYLLLKR
jgi:hypothetical protein